METLETLSSRIDTTEEIRSIVRTMKSLSAVSIRQYERAMEALETYAQSVELGLQAVLRADPSRIEAAGEPGGRVATIVFGSDRGLCGRFNERVTDLVARDMAVDASQAGTAPALLMVIGARAAARLEAQGLDPSAVYFLPGSAVGLIRTVQEILVQADQWRAHRGVERIRVYHNCRAAGAAPEPESRLLLPLSQSYLRRLAQRPWPTRHIPTHRMETGALLSWLMREHLLVSLFRAGAESLASEHAARLAAMKGAERNIEERLEELTADYRRQRQDAITTELMDIVSGMEAMRARAGDPADGDGQFEKR